MFLIRELAAFDFVNILPDGIFHLGIKVAVFFHKFGSEPFEHTQHIVDDQDLTVAVDTRPDADCGYAEGLGYLPGKGRGEKLKIGPASTSNGPWSCPADIRRDL